jgi:CRP-like cAMP-binding protein
MRRRATDHGQGIAQGNGYERVPAPPPAQNSPSLHGADGPTAIANARAHIDQRLTRWILMTHDRIRDDTLPLKQEFLALMLGVTRASVTEALQSLKRQKLIHTAEIKSSCATVQALRAASRQR